MNLSITDKERNAILGELKTANIAFQIIYSGDKPDRQPVHTVYGGANLFKSDSIIKLGLSALKSFTTNAENFVVLAKLLETDDISCCQKKMPT